MTPDQRRTLAATGLGLFMIFLDALIVNVGLPAIQADFGVGEAGLQWVVAAYSLGMAVFIMTSATLADMHGRRKVYISGLAVFTVASLACGMAPTLDVLNVSRGIQGAAAATVNVTSLALVSAAFPDPRQKARAIGIWAAIAGVSNAIGPTLGGFLVETVGWRAIFWVNGPVGILVIALTLMYVAESRDDRPRTLDVPGQALFMVAVGTFAYAVIEGPHAGWGSMVIVSCFAVAAVAFLAFIRVERRAADPMMDLTLFRDGEYSVAIGTVCVVLFTLYGMLLMTTQYLQNVRAFTPVQTGMMLLPFSVAMLVGAPLAGRLVGRLGTVVPIRTGLGVMMAGLVGLMIGMGGHPVVVALMLALTGFGFALCLTPITTLAMTSVEPRRAGMASGIMSAQRAIGSTLGFAIMGTILSAWLAGTLDHSLSSVIVSAPERATVARTIVADATPRAHVSEIAPAGRPVHVDAAVASAIRAAAERDFITGMRVALSLAIVLLAIVFALGLFAFPRGPDASLAVAQKEAAVQVDP